MNHVFFHLNTRYTLTHMNIESYYNCRAVDKEKQFSTKDAPMLQIQKESFGVLQKWMKMENTFITVRTMDTVNNHVSSKTGGRL